MVAVIIGCEIGFWALLLLGLAVRYFASARRLSTILLACVPLIDVVLLAVSVIDLRAGGTADTAHGLAAIYIGVSVAFGPQMIDWADQRFAYRLAGAPQPRRPPTTGRAHAAHERSQWFRHLAAYVIAAGVLVIFTALVGDTARAAPLWIVLGPWGVVLAIDFLISFSYTIAPRREKPSRSSALTGRGD